MKPADTKSQLYLLKRSCISGPVQFRPVLFKGQYILDSNHSANMWPANIFSHSIGCLFTLLIVSFAVQKAFTLMWSYLSVFASVIGAFGVISKKPLPRPVLRILGIFSRSFTILGLILSL